MRTSEKSYPSDRNVRDGCFDGVLFCLHLENIPVGIERIVGVCEHTRLRNDDVRYVDLAQ